MAETREQQPLGMFGVPVPLALASTGTWRTVPSTSSRHSQGSLAEGQDGFSDLQGRSAVVRARLRSTQMKQKMTNNNGMTLGWFGPDGASGLTCQGVRS